ncbi:hypothetical protein [Nocardia sp. NBC_01329]|uniref:hypothetical protein n=1 Tax=Nocardia sp. NBC_01329 TaxID=2903594 RepID=UPI002E124AE2|nr:hypothetical protein OG405_21815 [Nocardia sp. NBC_01329]
MPEIPSNHAAERPATALPALPRRTTPNGRESAAAAHLWQAAECYDRATLERVAGALRDLDVGSTGHMPRQQHEIDGVIARYRAAHPETRYVH